ncbi:MAG: anti-sigma factor antagonist [Firmicutes bacterium]|nr:anti-sigma factor antagonist [Bacillota bacterium]MCL5038697.1 anti-sigma factor antagonist [Bacillota bacterium]
MPLVYERFGDILVLRPQGDLDLGAVEEFRRVAERALDENKCRKLLINLKGVTFIDSSGLGVILGRYKRISLLGGQMAFTQVPLKVKPILELSGLLKIIPFYDTEKKALERM